jgi:hypothetical protein
LSFKLVGGGECASVLLDDLAWEPDTGLDGMLELLALHDLRDETAHKGVTCTVGVNDQVLGDGWDREFLRNCFMAFVVDRNENGVMTLGDDRNTGSLGVDLLPLGNGEADILERWVFDLVSFSEALGLILVAEYVVGVLEDSINFFGVELNQEAGGEVVPEGLVMLRGKASVVQESIVVGGDEECRGVQEVGLLEGTQVRGQVLGLILHAGCEVGAEGALLLVD